MKSFVLKSFLFVICCTLLVAWNNPQKPKVFLIGDSISVQYWPFLTKHISGLAEMERKKDNGNAEKNLDVPTDSNGGDSRMVLDYLLTRFNDPNFKPDYLMFNCGLHDIKYNPETGSNQVTEENYRKNINAILDLLKQKKVKPIWIRTTYVVDSIHNTRSKSIVRYEKDVLKYNAIADEICQKRKIPSIDLYAFSKQLGIEHVIDHVHYDHPARAMQAAYITGFMQNILNVKSPKK